ncbi:unnamed protein product [Rotaria sordida]|uniref:Uncharacterized protein n=1 Tax=Rotaria sordida TaxID=392033 RepID=A0A814C6J1_9BILA|nr:unnamed protein product [Rotaria sordida]CAF1359727.1 unnamed protein product [Rotaria sordida]
MKEKEKKIEDKIPKPGGKRPRQCDKENNYSSPYFTSNNNNTSIANKTHEVNNHLSSISLPINTLSRTLPLRNVSSLSPSSSAVTVPTPTLIRSVRLISPINLAIIPLQQNQYMVIQLK